MPRRRRAGRSSRNRSRGGGAKAGRPTRHRGLAFEALEPRAMLAADYGDAAGYGSASHDAIGPRLGPLRDSIANATNLLATGDAADEDGVVFSPLRAGQTGTMTVNVQNAPTGARLDAWIDFGRDNNWGSSGEQIAYSYRVVAGDNVIPFDVPAGFAGGFAYARVRLSHVTGLPSTGLVASGEVEDYLVPIGTSESVIFGGAQPFTSSNATSVAPADYDGDGDVDFYTGHHALIENIQGRPTPLNAFPSSTGGGNVIPADVDGDGDSDVFALDDNGVRWLENTGSSTFTARVIESNSQYSIAPADVDGDGDVDLVAGSFSQVVVYLNDGSQAFTKVAIPGSMRGARSLSVMDKDGDGDLDILAASTESQTSGHGIQWLDNDGSQNFTPLQVGPRDLNLRMARPADLDDDVDVVVAYAGRSGVAWYENDGQAYTHHPIVGLSGESVDVADIDGDGDLDLAASGNSRLVWYENDGAANFAVHTVAAASGLYYDATIVDVDGDGRLDLVATGFNGAPAAWYRQMGQFDYGDAPAPYRGVYLQDNGPRHIATGPTLGAQRDAEIDGVRTATGGSGGEAEDDGVTFGAVQAVQSSGTVTVNVQNAPAGAKLDAWVDFDGDGSWGLAGEQIFASLLVVAGDNALAFAIPGWAVPGATYARFRVSTAGGLGTGGVALDGEVEDYPLTIAPPPPATGLFGAANPITAGPAGFTTTADVDGDGDNDVVTGSGSFAWHENLGSAGFTMHVVPDSLYQSEDIAAGDLDSDGDVDFIAFDVLSPGSVAALLWMENDGSQNFTRHVVPFSLTGGVFTSLSIADIDGDGDNDVLAAKSSPSIGVYVLVNNGSEQFAARRLDSTGSTSFITSIVAADMDRDGDLDIVAAGQRVSNLNADILWFQNNGGLSFASRIIKPYDSSSGTIPESIAVGDIDSDGDLDIVAAGSVQVGTPTTLTWHEQLADGAFATHAIDVGRRLRWVTVADFDADGDLDLMTSGSTSSIDLYENRGVAQFQRRQVSDSRNGSWSVAAADMDNDGDLDAVGVDVSASVGVAWFENLDLQDAEYGDAPAPYATTRAGKGAVHIADGPRLGALRDEESDGAPSPHADAHSDDDGVTWGSLQIGQAADFRVLVSNAPQGALLDAWIDLDGDGSWLGSGEHFIANRPVVDGDNHFTLAIPGSARPGETFVRFRVRTSGEIRPDGSALDGEVEDYAVTLASADVWTRRFSPARSLHPSSTTSGEALTRVGDFDGDGDADVFYGGSPAGWQENDGTGRFTFHQLSIPGSLVDAQLADLDDDGDQDIVLATSSTVYWVEVRGGAPPLILRTLPNGSVTSSLPNLTVADLDGDGDRDIVARRSGSGLTVWLNDGAQNFAISPTLTTQTPVNDFELVDVDRDGDLDFVVGLDRPATSSAGKLSWYERRGGEFIEHALTLPSSSVRPLATVAGDFDADGDVDLVVEFDGFSPRIHHYVNGGSGAFTSAPVNVSNFYTTTGPLMSVADLNGDGRLDVLHTTSSGVAALLLGLPAGGFAVTSLPPGSTNSISHPPQAADINGDGRLDFLRAARWYAQIPSADYDGDSDVDGNDFLRWQRYLGRTPDGTVYPDGDVDIDVDAADLQIWRDGFGIGTDSPPSGAAASAVALAVPDVSAPPAVSALPESVLLTLNSTPSAQPPQPISAARPYFRPTASTPHAHDAALAAVAVHGTRPSLRPVAKRSGELSNDSLSANLLDDIFAGF